MTRTVTPLPTWESPLSDEELWALAEQESRRLGGVPAMVRAAEQMAVMAGINDRARYATWAGVALRVAKLGPLPLLALVR